MNKNLAASVLGRLKNISKELNLPYNLVMQLFAQERLLYRLSLTKYKDNFLFKVGLLLFSMTEFKGRPTKDIGFGDIVVPEAVNIRYPVLLDFDQPDINAYSLETVIAENF